MKISKFLRFFWYFDHQNHENIKIPKVFFCILITKTMKISKFPRFFCILITKTMKISKFPRFFWDFDHQNHENIKIS